MKQNVYLFDANRLRLGHSFILKGNNEEMLFGEARRLAATLNCLEEDGVKRPCGKCAHCRQIAGDAYPYWFVIAPQGAANLIRIGQIR